MIRLGTSGFSYDDWIGPVYPEDLPRIQWLPFYSTLFDTVELNVTYYRIPSRKVVEGWVKRTPEEFTFSVKAHRSLTHERKDPDIGLYAESVMPLVEASKLACVLLQFPHSFRPSQENRDYLLYLRRGLDAFPVVVEFRHSAWVSDDTFTLLESNELGFCCVDEPNLKGLMPSV